MDKFKLELYWSEIPVGKENAVTYPELMQLWNKGEREVRALLHELSLFDNGDDYILVRSSNCKGFYKTDDFKIISLYKKECLNKGKSIFAPVKKINRILAANREQMSVDNNLRVVRETKNLKQNEVCKKMKEYDRQFDKSLLSKMENGVCLPTLFQLSKLAAIYGSEPFELIATDLYI